MDDLDQVAALLAAAGLDVGGDLEAIRSMYPALRRDVEAQYAVDTGDRAPAVVLRAAEVAGPEGRP
jgi:hypothetical protein